MQLTTPSPTITGRPRLRMPNFWMESLRTVVFIIAMVTGVNLASARAVVDGPSMEPTLFTGQFLLISRVHYMFGELHHGDIAVFFPPNEPERLVKRVIGLPGDVIEIRNQLVYRNGVQLNEPYFINAPCTPSKCTDARWELGKDQYFMMGDNRNRSRDSRVFGPVPKENFIGRAVFRYIPVWEMRYFNRPTQ